MRLDEIHLRDPFILPVKETATYYLYGTTDEVAWSGPGIGFNCYKSKDLENWDGPIAVYRRTPEFWATRNFRAPEIYKYKNCYFMFASFKAHKHYRGTQILVSESPEGPFVPYSNEPITPISWECLDGTLHIDQNDKPWVVFSHDSNQVYNGAIYAMRISEDLMHVVSRPIFLFNATDAPWVKHNDWPLHDHKEKFPFHVADGPFLFRMQNGELCMLWSSFSHKGYALGLAKSSTDEIDGEWLHKPVPLWDNDGGHGMFFTGFDGILRLTFHTPNRSPNERPMIIPVEETGSGIRLVT